MFTQLKLSHYYQEEPLLTAPQQHDGDQAEDFLQEADDHSVRRSHPWSNCHWGFSLSSRVCNKKLFGEYQGLAGGSPLLFCLPSLGNLNFCLYHVDTV